MTVKARRIRWGAVVAGLLTIAAAMPATAGANPSFGHKKFIDSGLAGG